MECTFTPSDDGTFIKMKVSGNITRDVMVPKIVECHALGQRLGIRKYLVDVTEARNTDTTLGNYLFANHDLRQTKGIDPFAKVATLISVGDDSHNFIETVNRNANVNFRLFTNRQAAEDHLRD